MPAMAMPLGGKATTFKNVTEAVRERETFKYDPSLLTRIRYNDVPGSVATSDLVTSGDTILTALAQLGTLQTNTARSLISLFDQDYQYFVAEASPTLPLVPNLKHQDHDEDLWLCGTAIPRHQGVCNHTLCLSDTQGLGEDQDADPNLLPLVFVPDLTADIRFSSKPYCLPGSLCRFYAAVPIRTRRGINIGVYCVMDTSPRQESEWTDRLTELMRNISRSIMDHLDSKRSMAEQRQSVRMNRGIGSFVEGKSTVSGWRHGASTDAFADNPNLEGGLNAKQQRLQRHEDHSGDEPPVHEPATEPWVKLEVPAPTVTTQNPSATGQPPASEHSQEVGAIFSRAANLIRESIEVEGCLFLDAQVRSFGGLGPSVAKSDAVQMLSQPSSQSSSDETNASFSNDKSTSPCTTLGYSTTVASSIDGAGAPKIHTSLSEKFLSKLLRRYPKGKIFMFDANGELQSSDSSEDDGKPEVSVAICSPGTENGTTSNGPGPKPWAKHREGYTMLEIFPGARTVAFVPLWDSRKERWYAGGFAYTCSPTRTFTIEGELSYLRAFGMIAVAETFRLESFMADKAKSDVLGSLSHELRSPLHGIILGVELLDDTDFSVFQGNIIHTIETCGRTLMDTVDHLLDFSKINNYKTSTRESARHGSVARGRRPTGNESIEDGLKSLYSNLRLDALVEEVIESVFAGFNFQFASVAQLKKYRASNPDVHANRRLDSMHAMEDFSTSLGENGNTDFMFRQVSISVDIDPGCAWAFHGAPGALRRIVMNVFGNALKYTQAGTIKVSLRQSTRTKMARSKERAVSLVVTDTGNGIAEDYLRNDLFKPFQQENHLSPGTGLGLSIVKQIVTQLRGKISVESRVGYGTTVSVTLPMMPVDSSFAEAKQEPSTLVDDTEFDRQTAELKGLRVRLLGLDGSTHSETDTPSPGMADIICRDWLHMDIVSESEEGGVAPDIILMSEEALSELTSACRRRFPGVVVCANALVAYHRSSNADEANEAEVLEFVSQPLGPRKLAKIFTIAFKRWAELQPLSPMSEAGLATMSLQYSSLKSGTSNSSHRGDASASAKSPPPSITSPTGAEADLPSRPQRFISQSPDILSQTSTNSNKSLDFLLVDDNMVNLRMLSSYMKKLKRPYNTSKNGQEALETYCESPERYNCIFMDISMPVMDGFEATRRIRLFESENNLSPVRIFALSGQNSSSAHEEAFVSGIDLFLTKPVRLKELSTILESNGLL